MTTPNADDKQKAALAAGVASNGSRPVLLLSSSDRLAVYAHGNRLPNLKHAFGISGVSEKCLKRVGAAVKQSFFRFTLEGSNTITHADL